MLFLLFSACDPAPAPEAPAAAPPAAEAPVAQAAAPSAGDLSGVVQENIAAGPYNYTHVKTAAGEDLWAAATGTPPAVGQTVSFSSAMPMKDFHSDTLNRDFPLVYFVEAINGPGGAAPAAAAPAAGLPYMPGAAAPSAATAEAPAIPGAAALVVAAPTGPAAGVITVEKAWTDKAALSGRQVTIKGKVVKATNGVLGKNWLHVQDGTGKDGTNDITLTTADTANVGDSITATGVLATDRDVGSGYAYPVIVLDAKLGG